MELRCVKCNFQWKYLRSQTLLCSARKSFTFAWSKGGVRERDYTQTIDTVEEESIYAQTHVLRHTH